MKKKITFGLIIFFLIIVGSYSLISYSISGDRSFSKFKELLNYENRQIIKKYIFPYKLIKQQEKIIADQDKKIKMLNLFWTDVELDFKQSGKEIETVETSIKLSNDKNFKKIQINCWFLQWNL